MSYSSGGGKILQVMGGGIPKIMVVMHPLMGL